MPTAIDSPTPPADPNRASWESKSWAHGDTRTRVGHERLQGGEHRLPRGLVGYQASSVHAVAAYRGVHAGCFDDVGVEVAQDRAQAGVGELGAAFVGRDVDVADGL